MRTFDFSPLFRTTVGFDRMARALDTLADEPANSFPPYNIESMGENDYRITMAVAGFGENDIDITAEGLSIDGNPMITKKADGNIHIGKNSLITPEDHSTLSDGRKVHHLWAEDDSNNKIPLNIYGSDLLIDGKSVQGQIDENKSNINNLGSGVASSTALTAALTATLNSNSNFFSKRVRKRYGSSNILVRLVTVNSQLNSYVNRLIKFWRLVLLQYLYGIG